MLHDWDFNVQSGLNSAAFPALDKQGKRSILLQSTLQYRVHQDTKIVK